MRMLKHIWGYLTSPQYRFWVNFCVEKEHIDRSMNIILENLAKRNHPLIHYPEIFPLDETEDEGPE